MQNDEILQSKISQMSLQETTKNNTASVQEEENQPDDGNNTNETESNNNTNNNSNTNGKRFQNNNNSFTRPLPSQVTNRVYVGNLSWQTSWQDLKDHMRKAGTVIFADVFLDEQGKSKGCGIVEYSQREEALEAIKMLTDTKIGNTDRPIFIREDRESPTFVAGNRSHFGHRGRGQSGYSNRGGGGFTYYRGRGGSGESPPSQAFGRQVFVNNLPYSTSWQELKDHFRSCGKIIRADTLIGPDGRPKGSGTVLFDSRYDAQRAIETLNNTEFQGRLIFVQEDKYA